MNEITESPVKGDEGSAGAPQNSYAMGVTSYLRRLAIEWYRWEIELEVVSDGYTLQVVCPPGVELQGKHKMFAAVLADHLRRCAFDPQKFSQYV